ncbi:twin-arginine translocase TatA/TatE family subunit [Pelotomaculum propionicicum]|uniref:twin-arginine translocase TatA/TatE family subunit n=1 Tax=Pelotomaculum propionicicum TaxID=258475 RepID=UPI003B8164AC
MPNIGATELILVLAVALIIFGPGKLPDLGKAAGKTIREFRRSSMEIMDDVESVASKEKSEGPQITEAAKANS